MTRVDSSLRSVFPCETGPLLLCFACVIMGGLLIPALGAGPLALDEHVSYWMLDSELPGTVLSRCLDYGAVPPLGSWIQALSLSLFGKSEWALRLPSLLAAWLSIVVVYFTALQLEAADKNRGALWGGVAACLLACHPDVLDEVRIGRCYGLVLLMASLLLLATVRWRENLLSILRALEWTGCAVALLWTHYTSAFLVAVTWGAISIVALRSDRSISAMRNLAISTLLLVILCLPLWSTVERLREWGPFLNMLAPETSGWQTVSRFWWLGLPLGGLSSWAVSTRSTQLSHESGTTRRNWNWLLLGCSLLPIVGIACFAVGNLSSLANPRYRVAYVPAGTLWVAQWFTRSGSWKPALVGLIVSLVASWSYLPLRPWQLGRVGSPADVNWHELNTFIEEQGQPGEPVFVQSGLVESSLVPGYYADRMFLEYVACRAGQFDLPTSHPRIGLPYFWDDATIRHFEDNLRSQLPSIIWIASATDTDLNRSSLIGIQQIAERLGYRIDSQVSWPQATLLRMNR